MGGKIAQRFELQLVELEQRRCRCRGRGIARHDPEADGVERRASHRRESQLSRQELASPVVVLPLDAPGEMRELQLRQVVGKTGFDILELDIAGDVACHAARKFKPQAQRTLATGELARQRQPFTPCRDVGVVEARVEPPLRLLPVAHGSTPPFAANVDGRRQFRRRRAAQTEPVAAKTVFEAQLDAIQHELRGIAQVVMPGDQRVPNDDLPLAKNPVGKRRVASCIGRVDFDAADMQHPGPIAAQREPRSLDHQLLQAQLQERYRRPRHDHFDHGQFEQRQRRRTGGIAHPEPGHDQLGIPTVPAGDQGIDFNRLAELARKRCRQRVAIGLHLREDDVADDQQHQGERGERRNQGGAGDPA